MISFVPESLRLEKPGYVGTVRLFSLVQRRKKMPICQKCGKEQASAEIRKNPTGPVCKDKRACKDRQSK